jgi:hypothetical protein
VVLLYVAINVVALALCIYAKGKLDEFLGAHPSIMGERDISALKELARGQMYMALAQLVLLLTALVIGLILIFKSGMLLLLLVLLANGAVFAAGKWAKSSEMRVWSLDCATPELGQAHQSIINTWRSKPFPDF